MRHQDPELQQQDAVLPQAPGAKAAGAAAARCSHDCACSRGGGDVTHCGRAGGCRLGLQCAGFHTLGVCRDHQDPRCIRIVPLFIASADMYHLYSSCKASLGIHCSRGQLEQRLYFMDLLALATMCRCGHP